MKIQARMATLCGIFLGLLSLGHPAHAFTEGACKADEQKLCGDVKPGEGAIRDCMKQHEADLSAACKDNIAEGKQKMEQKIAELKEACKQDLQQFCATVTPGQGREIACLRSYDDKLSASCKEKLPKMGMHKGMGHHDKDNGGNQNEGAPPPPAK